MAETRASGRSSEGVKSGASSRSADDGSSREWAGALHGDREAFNKAVEPYLGELLAAARREVRYRVALGELGADDLTPEELVGETLVRAWRDRHRKPPLLRPRAWLLALLFRVSESIVRKEARYRKLAGVSLEAPVPPEPIYDDDEEFYEWYQPDEMTRWEDLAAEPTALTPEEIVEIEESLLDQVPPRTRLVYLLHDRHGLTMSEVAQAVGIPGEEAARLLAEARREAGGGKAGNGSK